MAVTAEQAIANSTDIQSLQQLIASGNNPVIVNAARNRLVELNRTGPAGVGGPVSFGDKFKTALTQPDRGQQTIQNIFGGQGKPGNPINPNINPSGQAPSNNSFDLGTTVSKIGGSIGDVLNTLFPNASRLRSAQKGFQSFIDDGRGSSFSRDLSSIGRDIVGSAAQTQEVGGRFIDSVLQYFTPSGERTVKPITNQAEADQAGKEEQILKSKGINPFAPKQIANLGVPTELPAAPQRDPFQSVDLSGFQQALDAAAPTPFTEEDAQRNTRANLLSGLGAGISNIGAANDIGDIFAGIGGNMLQARANAIQQNTRAVENYRNAQQKFQLLKAEGKLTEAKSIADTANKNLDIDYENALAVFEQDMITIERADPQIVNANQFGITVRETNDKGELVLTHIPDMTRAIIASQKALQDGNNVKLGLIDAVTNNTPNANLMRTWGEIGPAGWSKIVGEEQMKIIFEKANKVGDEFSITGNTKDARQAVNNTILAELIALSAQANGGKIIRQRMIAYLKGNPLNEAQ